VDYDKPARVITVQNIAPGMFELNTLYNKYAYTTVKDQQAKDTLFRNRLQCLLFLVSIAGTTDMNMSIENIILHLLCQTISMRRVP